MSRFKFADATIIMDGVPVGEGIVEVEITPAEFTGEQHVTRLSCVDQEFTAPVVLGSRLGLYSLYYGRKITNNWLKMHGGVMVRRNGKRKRKKKSRRR